MKQLLFLLALSAATPTLAQDQAQTPQPDTAVTNLAPAPESAPFQWRLRLRAGQKFLTTTETSTQSSQQMPAMPSAPKKDTTASMESSFQFRTVIEQNVLSADDNGARIELVYREMTQRYKTEQGGKVVFDSANPRAGRQSVADLLKSIEGTRITYSLSPKGQISDIQGVEAYLEGLNAGLEKATAQTPALAAQQKNMRETMAGFLSPDSLKDAIGAAFHAMPSKVVAQGETWNYDFTLPVNGTTFTQSGQGTFVSRADGVVTIAQKGEFSTNAGAEFKMPLPTPRDKKVAAPLTQLDLHGSLTGETLIDEQSGMTLRNRATQNLEGEMVISGMAGRGSALSIPMKMKIETTSTTVELKTTP